MQLLLLTSSPKQNVIQHTENVYILKCSSVPVIYWGAIFILSPHKRSRTFDPSWHSLLLSIMALWTSFILLTASPHHFPASDFQQGPWSFMSQLSDNKPLHLICPQHFFQFYRYDDSRSISPYMVILFTCSLGKTHLPFIWPPSEFSSLDLIVKSSICEFLWILTIW